MKDYRQVLCDIFLLSSPLSLGLSLYFLFALAASFFFSSLLKYGLLLSHIFSHALVYSRGKHLQVLNFLTSRCLMVLLERREKKEREERAETISPRLEVTSPSSSPSSAIISIILLYREDLFHLEYARAKCLIYLLHSHTALDDFVLLLLLLL